MANKHGSLSIDSDNLFPIIKKWLYSDHDIFYRELISNGCDAITKLKKLDMMGEYTLPADFKAKISVTVDPEAKTLTFTDNGLGMTADEVEEYICQIAFSGATDFIQKYKDKSTDDQIIGHFGLGFYSAFMVADEVEIDTLSYKEGATPVHWTCDGGTDYELTDGTKTTIGTQITLHLNEDCLEFANEYRAREVIEKYCSFMPTEIYLSKANAEPEYETIDAADKRDTDTVVEEIHEEAKTEEKENENGEKETVEISPAKDKLKILKRPVPLNDTNPLWLKNPNDCTDEEYKAFYRKVFLDYKEPLFWIHLNVDYPFNLKGILYFPRIRKDFGGQEGQIKLFNRQVFVADNIKEIIPEFLLLLRGVLDCPDLPLNVSRSFLQNDGYVRKLSAHITKKVADKLNSLMNTEREKYQTYWDDIHPFVKYGCIRDAKFHEAVKGSILFKTTAGEYLTLAEYRARNEGKTEKKVYYTTDAARQAASVALYTARNIDVVVMDSIIDISFMQHMEQQEDADGLTFARVDADVDGLVDKDAENSELALEPLEKLFRDALGDEQLKVKLQPLADGDLPLMLLEDEQMRRYREMAAVYGDNFKLPERAEVVLNSKCEAIRALAAVKDPELQKLLAKQYFDIARMSTRPLENEELSAFIRQSYQLAARLAEKED